MIDNITLYKYFMMAINTGSLSKVAREMYVTQPAVSNAIQQLEDALEVKLFFRTSRGITPTPEGELLREYVANALSFLEAGEDKLRDIAGLRGGVLRVGASDMTLKFYLLDHLQRFNSEYPGVKLSVTNNPTPRTIEALKNGRLDFCVVSEPVENDSDIEFVPVRKIRDIACAAPSIADRISPNGEPVEFEALAKETIIMLERGTSTRTCIERHFTRCGLPEDLLAPSIELAQSDLLLEFALRELGVIFVVEDFAREAVSAGKLREIPLAKPFPERSFLMAYLKKIPLAAAAKHFIDEMK